MDGLETMLEKFGFPVVAACWMTWYGWYMTKRYIAATESQGAERTNAAVELVKNNVALASLSLNSTTAIQRNTESNDNLSGKIEGLSTQMAKITGCEAKTIVDRYRESK